MNTPTTVMIGRYDIDADYARKRWLRDAFLFQREPLSDLSSPYHGCYLGMDTASVAQRGSDSKDLGVVVFITPELNAEFALTTEPHQ